KARKDEIQPTPAPETPVSDAYIITMRPKDAAPKRREMLDDLVVQEEQRKREEWLRAEEVRAAVLPHQLQAEVQQAAWIESINNMLQERQKAIQEFEEYKKYSEAYAEAARRTDVTYSDYLKAFKAGETRLGYDEWKQPYIQ